MKPNGGVELVLLDAKDRLIEYARVKEMRSEDTSKTRVWYSCSSTQVAPSFCDFYVGKTEQQQQIVSKFDRYYYLSDSVRSELMSRLFYDPQAIVDSSCFAFLIDVFDMSTQEPTCVFSSLLELNEDETCFEGKNLLLEGEVQATEQEVCYIDGWHLHGINYVPRITIVRADGAVFFCPTSEEEGDEDATSRLRGLFGYFRHGTVHMNISNYSDFYTIQYRLYVNYYSGEQTSPPNRISSISLHRGLCHSDNEMDFYKNGRHVRNFGADAFGRRWNYDCQVSIPNNEMLRQGFSSVNLANIPCGKRFVSNTLTQDIFGEKEEPEEESEEDEECWLYASARSFRTKLGLILVTLGIRRR